MIIYGKYKDDDDNDCLATYPSEENIDLAMDLADVVEILVDFSELKNYKKKYDEIYKTLFKSYTDIESEANEAFDDIIFTTCFSENKKDYSFSSFSSLEKVMSFIDDEVFDSEASCLVLINISEIKDYKEKYDEFYTLMLDNFKDNRSKTSF